MDRISVKDIMVPHVITLRPTSTVIEAAELMSKKAIGCVIVAENNIVQGIVTERDLVRKVLARARDPRSIKLKEIMTSPVKTISPENDVIAISKKMAAENIRRLPVLDAGKLVGIVTDRDLLRVQPAIVELLNEKLAVFEGVRENGSGECHRCKTFTEKLMVIGNRLLCSNCVGAI